MSGKSIGKRAWAYLSRRRKKTVILAAVFFILSLLSLSGLAISGAVQDSLKELREQFFATLSVEQTSSEEYKVTPQMAADVEAAVQPDGWTGITYCYLAMEELNLIPGRYTGSDEDAMHIAKLVACRDSSLAREFTGGTLELTQGRHTESQDQRTAMISETLAQMNRLSLGDTITGTVTDNVVVRAAGGIGTQYELEIVGIYRTDPEEDNTDPNRAECEIYDNYIFVDEATGFDIQETVWQMEPYYPSGLRVWMHDPGKLEAARTAVEALPGYAWENYLVDTNGADYKRSAAPLTQTETIWNLFLGVTLVIGTVFLTVLLTLWNRERTREIGIFLSMGCSRKNIMAQLMLESVGLFLTSFLVSLPMYFIGMGAIKYLAALEGISSSLGDILTVGLVGSLLSILVTVVSTVTIMQKKPTELLTTII